ncbi:hydroxyquinol 1,2-dioxygenase [Cupriavidus necator]
MITNLAKCSLVAITLVAAATGSQAASPSSVGAREPFTDGARSGSDPRDPYTDGARSVQEPRSPYTDGTSKFDPYYDGARSSSGLNLTDAPADPAQSVEPIPAAPSRDVLPRSSRKSK